MQMFFEAVNNNVAYIMLGMSAVIVIIFIFCISLSVKLSKLKKRYEKFTGGGENNSENLETMITTYSEDVKNIGETYGRLLSMVQELDEEMKHCTQKVGVVRYNPFEEMGGNLCYAVALLDSQDNGVVLNGIHGRNGSFTYAKPIERGVSPYVLTDEELQALEKAKENAYKSNDEKKIMKVIKPSKTYRASEKIRYNKNETVENKVEYREEMPKPRGGFDIDEIAESIFGSKEKNIAPVEGEKENEISHNSEMPDKSKPQKESLDIDEFNDFSAFDAFKDDIDKSK